MQECDLGQQSVLHAVKARTRPITKRSLNVSMNPSIQEDSNESFEEHGASKPLSQTLTELRLDNTEKLIDNGMFLCYVFFFCLFAWTNDFQMYLAVYAQNH